MLRQAQQGSFNLSRVCNSQPPRSPRQSRAAWEKTGQEGTEGPGWLTAGSRGHGCGRPCLPGPVPAPASVEPTRPAAPRSLRSKVRPCLSRRARARDGRQAGSALHKPAGVKRRGRAAPGPQRSPVTAATRAWRGQGAPPECPHPDWCRALAPPPPHGSVLRHPPDGPTALERRGRPHGSQRWGKEATEPAGPAPEGEGAERTTGGPQPSCAHPPPSLTSWASGSRGFEMLCKER